MKFRTEVDIPSYGFKISHADKIFLTGSCFVENIGNKLDRYLFDICLNPFGIVYNPASIVSQLETVLSGKIYTEKDLQKHNELFFSFDHHGDFSDVSAQKSLEKINTRLEKAGQYLKSADYFFFTFGTAWIYRHNQTGKIVANCHKLPASEFTRERLSPEEITSSFTNIISQIKQINPTTKFIFTVSPVRHWKDGAIENNLSKSILTVAIHEIIKNAKDTFYFPSFEIVYDELRDYRFYARDMIHLNDTAVDFIWEKFTDAFFDDATLKLVNRIEKIRKDLEHRPLFPGTESHNKFIAATQRKIKKLKNEFPFLDIGRLQ